MQSFDSLTHWGQVPRLRRVAAAAVAAYGLTGTPLRLLSHRGNTLFAVGDSYVLRVCGANAPPVARSQSELDWLTALCRDTDLTVPEPMPSRTGQWVIEVAAPGLAAPRQCVLVRRVAGRFVDAGLRPIHLARVGALMATLHRHADNWVPPVGFDRRHAGWLWLFEAGAVFAPGGDAGLFSPADRAVFAAAAARIQAELATLEAHRADYGLIHADLQQTNYLFHGTAARAIDFADCCWGYYLYDMAIPLFEIADRPNGAAMRAAFFAGYSSVRPLPADAEAGIRLFTAIRLLKRINYLAHASDPALRAQASRWVAYTVAWLRAWT
ncbi:MAG: phosphotransferase [Chloroflexota bacterium]|nr:phosphotransferase [Chloroflexota bacterium]